MSKSTISTFELFQMFPDAEAARIYMEGKRWPTGAICPACDEAPRAVSRAASPPSASPFSVASDSLPVASARSTYPSLPFTCRRRPREVLIVANLIGFPPDFLNQIG